jgi:hypothetical protein
MSPGRPAQVQQADVLAQMRQLYGKALGLVGLDAMFLRLWHPSSPTLPTRPRRARARVQQPIPARARPSTRKQR